MNDSERIQRRKLLIAALYKLDPNIGIHKVQIAEDGQATYVAYQTIDNERVRRTTHLCKEAVSTMIEE